MTIDELIARLEDYRDEIGGDAEVRLIDDAVLFIVEGQQLGYGTKRAWDVARNN